VPRVLSSDGLRLRPYRADDAEPLLEAALESADQLAPYETWFHADYSLDEAVEHVGWWVTAWESARSFYFVVEDAESRQFLGSCGLSGVDREHRAANMGFWVRSSRAGRGVATSAARLVAAYGFETLDLNRIELVMPVHNAASRRVAVKLGATEEGTLRERLVVGGRPTDCVSYSILRSEAASLFD
jgi:ribosomal-protein-serine acetyltransferase